MPSEVSTIGGDQSGEKLRRELDEAREQQAATAEILAAISNSPTDPSRVFAEIASSAARLCDAYNAAILRVVSDHLLVLAVHGPLLHIGPVGQGKIPLKAEILVARAVIDKKTIHVVDLQAETKEYPAGSDLARQFGHRTIVAVPLVRSGEAIGAIAVRRTEVRPFTDRQIELLKTFADQAVIAIENTRLFEAEQASKRELQESLQYQTATAEVLSVISRSPNQLQPVLDAITQTAARLCQADYAHFRLLRDGAYHVASSNDYDPLTLKRLTPIAPGPGSIAGLAALECRTVHLPDILADATGDYSRQYGEIARTGLGVPLVKNEIAVGVIMLFRKTVCPFAERQIALVNTFAEQALIAMENTRLFEEVQARTRELQESLEYQTATSEVLSVISRSPNDVRPVLDTIARIAQRLCQAEHAFVLQREEEGYRLVAANDAVPDWVSAIKAAPLLPDRGSLTGRVALERRTVHVDDLRADPEYTLGPTLQHGVRSELGVPLMRDGEVIGVIIVGRTEVRPFTERQIALIETFADQAVIAIENTRLFEAEQASKRELQESLEYQTAISGVLGVIGRSKFDLQPVLTAIVSTACRLCDARDASIALRQGEWLEFAAGHGSAWVNNEWIHDEKLRIVPELVAGRAILERKPIHIHDITFAGEDFARSRELAISRGHRTALAVPLLREEQAIGCIFLRRSEVRPFSDKQVALLGTFADQAVIAIENVRLFEEIAQKSRELEIASQHKSQFVANMSHELRTPLAAMLGYAELMQEGIYGALPEKSLPILTRIRSNGKHLLGLINTVLDISKIEAGQFKLNLGEYALDGIVETVMGATESLAATKKLAFKAEIAKGLPNGLGDEQRLTQVLLNLVGNAIKFTDSGEVRIVAGAANGHFALSVKDTGPGIPAEECEQIFEKFRQVDSSNTRAKGGTGLGLAITREIVALHGGRIWVESTIGEGSTFHMELPVRATAAAGAA